MGGGLGVASIPFFACACLLVVLVLQITSFASPHWAHDDVSDFGLWKYSKCVPRRVGAVGNEECFGFVKRWEVGDWLNAVRGFQCLAIIFWSIPMVVVPVYLYVALGLYYRCTIGVMTAFTFLGAICNIIGDIVFFMKIEDNSQWEFEWCLIVACIAGVLSLVSFIIFIVALFNRPIFSSNTHLMSGFYVDPDRNKMYVVENLDEKSGLDGGHINSGMTPRY